MPMNILRKLSTLVKAMALRSPDQRPAETIGVPQQGHGAGPERGADSERGAELQRTTTSAQQASNRHADAAHRPLDRSRVADLLARQDKAGEDTSTQRKKGDRS
jgi:hypothetical protein